MEMVALGLLLLGAVLAEPVSRALAAARWPTRDPVGALLAWQAIGLAGGMSLLGAGVVYALSPLGPSLPVAAGRAATLLGSGRPVPLGAWHLLALLAALIVACRMIGVLVAVTVRTLRGRARHRDLLDLLGTPWPVVPGAHVLHHPVPVAYCLPGLRSRLVVSAGALDVLEPPDLAAVLAHERAHLRERHDLVVLPFVAWGATAPFVRGMVCAQIAVARLVEMRADDVAVGTVAPRRLAAALRGMHGAAPTAALSSFGAAVEQRLARLAEPPPPLPTCVRVSVRLAAAALVVLPTVMVLAP